MDRADLEQWKGREVARLLALVETERRYYQEIDASFPMGAAIVSRSGAIVFANRAFRRLAGIRPGEVQFKAIDQVLPSARLARCIQETLRSLEPRSNLPVELGGHTFQASIIPMSGWEDDPESEALIVLEAVSSPLSSPLAPEFGDWPALLWTMHPETQQFLTVNGAHAHFLGYSPLHWTSTPDFWRERVHSDDRRAVVEFYRSAMRKGGEFGCEYRALTASRQTIWCRDSFRVTLDSSGAAIRITGITIDVTARRRSEQDNIRANRTEALAGLSRRISHDFNNSLMIVTGYAEELMGHLEERDPKRSDIHSILSAAEAMAGITGELSGFTRKQSSAPGATDLSSVLTEVAARIRDELGATLVLRQPQQRLSAYADSVQLEAILLAVARKLRGKSDGHMVMVAGEVSIDEMSNLPHALNPGRYVEISIRGPFTSEVPATAFETLLSGKDPHGSDMARAYAITREWGGTVYSGRTEHTSEVHVVLPAMGVEQPVAVPAASLPVIETPGPAEPEAPPATAVLVVENEKGIRGLIQKILKREGYEVLVAADADEAEEVASKIGSLRLVVTDLNAAGKSGRAVAERLSEKHPGLRALYISGYTDDPEVTTRELGAGAPFLQKPFTLAALTRKVREILEPALIKTAAASTSSN